MWKDNYFNPDLVERIRMTKSYVQEWTVLSNIKNRSGVIEVVFYRHIPHKEYSMTTLVRCSSCGWEGPYGDTEVMDLEYLHCPGCREDILHLNFIQRYNDMWEEFD